MELTMLYAFNILFSNGALVISYQYVSTIYPVMRVLGLVFAN
jgi:hypothetical protein